MRMYMSKTKENLLVILPEQLINSGKNNLEFLIPITIAFISLIATFVYELSLPKYSYLLLLLPLTYCLYLVFYFRLSGLREKIKEKIYNSSTKGS